MSSSNAAFAVSYVVGFGLKEISQFCDIHTWCGFVVKQIDMS